MTRARKRRRARSPARTGRKRDARHLLQGERPDAPGAGLPAIARTLEREAGEGARARGPKDGRWVDALALNPHVRAQVVVMLTVMAALEEQLELVEKRLRRLARADRRCQALETIFGVGLILARRLLAEIGDFGRFRRAHQLVRASGLDPAVEEYADSRRRGHLAKQGSRHLCLGPGRDSQSRPPPDQPRARPLHEHRLSRARSPAAPTTSSQPELRKLDLRTIQAPAIGDSLWRAPSAPGSTALPTSGNEPPQQPPRDLLHGANARRYGFGPIHPNASEPSTSRPPPLLEPTPSI